jgi:hypothetical protein
VTFDAPRELGVLHVLVDRRSLLADHQAPVLGDRLVGVLILGAKLLVELLVADRAPKCVELHRLYRREAFGDRESLEPGLDPLGRGVPLLELELHPLPALLRVHEVSRRVVALAILVVPQLETTRAHALVIVVVAVVDAVLEVVLPAVEAVGLVHPLDHRGAHRLLGRLDLRAALLAGLWVKRPVARTLVGLPFARRGDLGDVAVVGELALLA